DSRTSSPHVDHSVLTHHKGHCPLWWLSGGIALWRRDTISRDAESPGGVPRAGIARGAGAAASRAGIGLPASAPDDALISGCGSGRVDAVVRRIGAVPVADLAYARLPL